MSPATIQVSVRIFMQVAVELTALNFGAIEEAPVERIVVVPDVTA